MPEDEGELSLRPKKLSEYIGQSTIKKNLTITLAAARMRNESVEHILLHGPPGLGKTSLAGVIANEMGTSFKSTSGPAIEKPGDLVAILSNLEPGMILFIDEIHRLNRPRRGVSLPGNGGLRDGHGDRAGAERAHDQDRPAALQPSSARPPAPACSPTRFATASAWCSSSSSTRRKTLTQIVVRSADILGVPIEHEGAHQLARRSRGTPRIANRLLKRARDWAQVLGDGTITAEGRGFCIEASGRRRTRIR